VRTAGHLWVPGGEQTRSASLPAVGQGAPSDPDPALLPETDLLAPYRYFFSDSKIRTLDCCLKILICDYGSRNTEHINIARP